MHLQTHKKKTDLRRMQWMGMRGIWPRSYQSAPLLDAPLVIFYGDKIRGGKRQSAPSSSSYIIILQREKILRFTKYFHLWVFSYFWLYLFCNILNSRLCQTNLRTKSQIHYQTNIVFNLRPLMFKSSWSLSQ